MVGRLYCMSKKSLTISYSKLLYRTYQGFLYIQYEGTALYIVCDTPTMYPNSHRNQQFSKQILTLYFVFF